MVHLCGIWKSKVIAVVYYVSIKLVTRGCRLSFADAILPRDFAMLMPAHILLVLQRSWIQSIS